MWISEKGVCGISKYELQLYMLTTIRWWCEAIDRVTTTVALCSHSAFLILDYQIKWRIWSEHPIKFRNIFILFRSANLLLFFRKPIINSPLNNVYYVSLSRRKGQLIPQIHTSARISFDMKWKWYANSRTQTHIARHYHFPLLFFINIEYVL